MTGTPALEVRNVSKHFHVRAKGPFSRPGGIVRAVDGASLRLMAGETLAVVGESGCGKTTLARTAARLQRPTSGSVLVDGQDITGLSRRALRPLRRRIQMVFQDPFGSLNPRLPVSAIIAEPLVIHGIGDRRERREKVEQLAADVGLSGMDLDRYPHQFSGGQRQRIAIARAIALEPRVVIADEPVSALDVSVQSQILNLLQDLQDSHGLSYLFISHDLAVVRHFAGRIAVMYLGRVVEDGPTGRVFDSPRHPYTQALIEAAPVISRGKRRRGKVLSGDVPSPLNPPPGCPFHPRCPKAQDICRVDRPRFDSAEEDPAHGAACHFADGEAPA